jgi:hypothetical protein
MANAERDKVVTRAEDIERRRRWRALTGRPGIPCRGVVTSVLPASAALTPNKPSESGSAQAKVVRPYGDHTALVRSESIAAKDMTVSGPGGGGFVTFANLNGGEVNVQVGLSFVSSMGECQGGEQQALHRRGCHGGAQVAERPAGRADHHVR